MTAKKLISVASTRKRRCVNSDTDKRKAFPDATSTVTSMLDWTRAAKFDDMQEQAFLTLTATSVRTYYEDV